MKLTNKYSIDLPIAVWLLQDGYKSGADKAPPGELISVTTLMKPTRQLILQRKVDKELETLDISELIASRVGHGLHDSLERAWTEGNWKRSMKRLGYSDDVINNIVINPKPEEVKNNQIPVYLEQRGFKVFQNLVITGQLDFAIDGAYRDFKTTSTYSYTSGKKDDDYVLQGSLYRWIMPELIQKDKMRIEFIFTDWLKYRAKIDPNYPQARATHKEFTLLSMEETEQWVIEKLSEIRENVGKSQKDMIRCNDNELWKSKDTYKYYARQETANKNGRCTKRFENHSDAILHLEDKGKGVIKIDPGEVKACPFCPAFTVCDQRKEYFNDDQSPKK